MTKVHTPSREQISHARAYLVLALGVFAIGWSAIFVRWSNVPGWTSAFWRMTIAQLVFVPWALGARARQPGAVLPVDRQALRAAIIAGAFFAADLALFNTAVMVSSADNATLLGTNAPIFVALGAWLLYRERPTRRFWTGFALSFVGMLAIVGHDLAKHPRLGIGDACAMIGAACYAGYLLYVRQSRATMDALTFSAISGVTAVATLLAICLVIVAFAQGGLAVRFTPVAWGSIATMAVVSTVLAFIAFLRGLAVIGPVRTAIVSTIEPFWTALLGALVLRQALGVRTLLGGICIAAAVVLLQLGHGREATPEPI